MTSTHLLCILIIISCIIPSRQCLAGIITVTNTNDTGPGSLRDTISSAIAGDEIQFDQSLTSQQITLASGLSTITVPLTITGLGASQLSIDGSLIPHNGSNYAAFRIAATATVTISGLTIANVYNFNSGGAINNAGKLTINECIIRKNRSDIGGGIYFTGAYGGKLTVLNSTFTENNTNSSSGGAIIYQGSSGGSDSMVVSNCLFLHNSAGGYGGAIFIGGGTTSISGSSFVSNYDRAISVCGSSGGVTRTAQVAISNCTIAENSGVGIDNNYPGTVTVTGSTISGNSGDTFGGGIANTSGTVAVINSTIAGNDASKGGGIYNAQGTVTVKNSTISGNMSSSGGGGIYQTSNSPISKASAFLSNTIVANNYNATSPDLYGNSLYSSVTANYCLVGDTTGAGTITGTNSILGSGSNPVDPLLGPLGAYGGPTMPDGTQMKTVALLTGSPAIGAGSNALNPPGITTDQRGLARIVDGTVDIGSYEFLSLTLTFDSQGGSAPNPATKSVTYGSTYGTLATTSRTSYAFDGWWTGANGTGTQVTTATTVTITTAQTLYAKWSVPSALQTWRQTWYGTTDNSGNAADTADPYHTGIPNLLVFAFLGPNQNPALTKISLIPQMQRNGTNLLFSFTQPTGVSAITYGAEWCHTLLSGSWTAVADTGTSPQHTFSVPVDTKTTLFMRLKVTSP